MKKITTVLAMIIMTLTLSTMALGQHTKRSGSKAMPPTGTHLTGTVSGMQGDNPISARKATSDEHGTVYARNNIRQRPQNGRNVIMANTEGDFHSRSRNLTVNGNAGNDQFQSVVTSSNQRRISTCGAGCNGDTMLIPFKQRR